MENSFLKLLYLLKCITDKKQRSDYKMYVAGLEERRRAFLLLFSAQKVAGSNPARTQKFFFGKHFFSCQFGVRGEENKLNFKFEP